jgi:AraC family transcriptional regulator, arabinose operon regulatory protein
MGRPVGRGWILTFTIDGRVLYRDASGVSFFAPAGELVLMHSDGAAFRGVLRGDSWEAFWLRFEPWGCWRPDGFRRVTERLFRTQIALPGNRQRVHEAWERIIDDLDARDTARIVGAAAAGRGRHPAGAEWIETELVLLRLREILLLALRDASISPHVDARIRAALQVMERDIARPPGMRELAARAGLSYGRFAHLFKSQLGVTPKRAQRLIRLRRAALQLEYSDEPVGAIAERTGFSSVFDFSRGFRREYGLSPSAYRARHQ